MFLSTFLSSLGTISAVHDVFNTSKQMWKYLSCLFQNYQFYFGLWCVLKRTEEVTSVKRKCFYLANIGSNQAKFSTHNYIVFTRLIILLPLDGTRTILMIVENNYWYLMLVISNSIVFVLFKFNVIFHTSSVIIIKVRWRRLYCDIYLFTLPKTWFICLTLFVTKFIRL